MTEKQFSKYSVYKGVIDQVMRGDEKLPSLPSLTLKIRQAINSDTATSDQIADLIEQDPALCAMMLKYAASPIYKTAVAPNSIEGVLNLLGRQAINNIVMLHSVSSLFIMSNIELKKLFKFAWKQLLTKTATCTVLAQSVGFRPADQVMLNCILSRLGSLAIISALKEAPHIPDERSYSALCDEYNGSLTTILLRKWGMDESLVKLLRHSGRWKATSSKPKLGMIDILNLGQQQALLQLELEAELPHVKNLAAFKKLPPGLNQVEDTGELTVLADKQSDISAMVNLMLT